MNKKGFTLAEILITLGIVGVVAAVTLPTLNVDVQKKGLSSQIAKFYSQYADAIQMYKSENETDSIPDTYTPQNFARKYFKITKECSATEGPRRRGKPQSYIASCFSQDYTAINSANTISGGDLEANGTEGAVSYMLADGVVMTIDGLNVIFDVNGLKGPNVIGYDLQAFTVFDDGSIDNAEATPRVRAGNRDDLDAIIDDAYNKCRAGSQHTGCFGHLLRNNFRFDY